MAIKQINIEGIWGGKGDIHWDNIHPDVNILVGSNGSGKSTLLNILRFLLLGNTKELKELVKNVTVCVGEGMIRYEVSEKSVLWETKNSFDVYYVNTFDIPSAKKSAQSQLTQQLDMLLYQRQKDVYSFTDYRLETTTRPRENVSQEHIHDFLNIINRFFASTGKTIHINERNEIVFDKTGVILTIEQLSSGEKQVLILLFTVFLMKQQTAVLLLDEPEISLHMDWQDKLIETLFEINPNCQVFLTTHSPNIFADGWGDKLVFICNILTER